MEFWPSEQVASTTVVSIKKGQRNVKEKEGAWAWPVLDHGALAAALPVLGGSALRWTPIRQNGEY